MAVSAFIGTNSRIHLKWNSGFDPSFVAVGDLNRDGKLDLALANRGASRVTVLLNAGANVSVDPRPTPARAELSAPRPNPFVARAALDFALPGQGLVRLEVFDVRGRLVKTLEDGVLPAGRHTRSWDGTNLAGGRAANGVYLVRLSAPGAEAKQKVVLLE